MSRDWWEETPRSEWREKATRRAPEITDKNLRDFLRWQEESWAASEMRSVGVKRFVVYR